ncbi:MAG: ElyC/SanA/YdcF family protein [Bryobacteraceae bacterium]
MNGGLLMLAGHAIYQAGKWHGGYPGEEQLYERHVRDALYIYAAGHYQALIFSGGHSRPHLTPAVSNSEAQGMRAYACETGILPAGAAVLLEEYGRDSFENLFFSILRFYREYGEWPSRVAAVSWKFKALRFYLIACGLHIADGRFTFYGSGDPSNPKGIEAFATASVQYDATIVRDGEIVDPLHRDPRYFAAKRLGRMPVSFPANSAYLARVKQEYGHAALLDHVESLTPGPAWRHVPWPWVEPSPNRDRL